MVPVYLIHITAFIPLGTLLALLGGLYAKKGLTPVMTGGLLVVVVIAMLAGGIYSSVAREIGSMSTFNTLIFYEWIPIVLFCSLGCICLALSRDVTMTKNRESILMLLGLALLTYTVWDIALFQSDPNGTLPLNALVRYETRWILQPLALAAILFYWLWKRPERWWIHHLVKGG